MRSPRSCPSLRVTGSWTQPPPIRQRTNGGWAVSGCSRVKLLVPDDVSIDLAVSRGCDSFASLLVLLLHQRPLYARLPCRRVRSLKVSSARYDTALRDRYQGTSESATDRTKTLSKGRCLVNYTRRDSCRIGSKFTSKSHTNRKHPNLTISEWFRKLPDNKSPCIFLSFDLACNTLP